MNSIFPEIVNSGTEPLVEISVDNGNIYNTLNLGSWNGLDSGSMFVLKITLSGTYLVSPILNAYGYILQ